jgi:hypothetical protein
VKIRKGNFLDFNPNGKKFSIGQTGRALFATINSDRFWFNSAAHRSSAY